MSWGFHRIYSIYMQQWPMNVVPFSGYDNHEYQEGHLSQLPLRQCETPRDALGAPSPSSHILHGGIVNMPTARLSHLLYPLTNTKVATVSDFHAPSLREVRTINKRLRQVLKFQQHFRQLSNNTPQCPEPLIQ